MLLRRPSPGNCPRGSGRRLDGGIERGGVILSINGKEIATAKKLPAIASSMKSGKRAAIQVDRSNARIFIPVDLG